jgi:hypothetical protein
MASATEPLPRNRVQAAFRAALTRSGLQKHASVHTLRHRSATPLLEAGITLRRIQDYLGQNSPTTTALSTPLTVKAAALARDALQGLMGALSLFPEECAMIELADIFRCHGPDDRAQCGSQMPRAPLRALHDIERCRTESLGGQMYHCEQCHAYHYSYHSCKNRHGPKGQNAQAEQWLEPQQSLLLPVPHFLVTFTLPAALRALARSHQQTVYSLLFRTASAALQELAWDPRFIGGRGALVGVLHTWTRDRRYHPHVHDRATGGGLAADGHWRPSRPDFLVPVKPLAVLFRAKFRDGRKKTALSPRVDEHVWPKDWVVHCTPVGRGQEALRYLAPYLFRVAISNTRILQLADGQVTFQYKESATAQVKTCTVTAEECIRRFLQHVLPARFVKVRYDGLLSPGSRHLRNEASQWLGGSVGATKPSGTGGAVKAPTAPPRGPRCGSPVVLMQMLRPTGRVPP